MRSGLISFVLFLLASSFTVGAQGKKMKIYISADMEGVVGAVSADQLSPGGFEYQRFREFMTAEVNAAIEAAFEAGATEIVVSDSHGNAQNLLIEKLPKNILLVRGFPRPLVMMQGIDETFDGVIFLGYHSSTTNPEGVRAHTMSSARLADVRLNDISMTEGGFNAAIAGHFDVPVIMVSGDDAAVEEVSYFAGRNRRRGREMELRVPLGEDPDARSRLFTHPRKGEEGDRPDRRVQAVQAENSRAAGCPLQELPSLGTSELSVDSRTHRFAQHPFSWVEI